MRRDPAEVSAVARQRLELLGRELGRPTDLSAVVVPDPGRHALPSRLPGWLVAVQDRVAWTPAHLAVVAVLAATALALVAWSVLRSAPEEIAAPSPLRPSLGSTPLVPTPSTSAATEVVVDVAGKVLRPGVATLPAGSRVIDAIRHAGGARRGVDLSTLNLARVLLDGEQILVGAPSTAPAAAGPTSAPSRGALVNLNAASVAELENLPGVGPVTAAKIVDWRTEHGRFTTVDELLEVDGIGTKTLAELAPHVTL